MSNDQNTGTERFSASFKPAPARGAVSWTLEGDTLLKNGKRAVDLSEVTGGNWMTMRHKGVVSRTLKLKSSNGNTSISVGTFGITEAHAQMKELSIRALARVAQRSPNALFNVAGGMGVIVMLFCFSLLAVAGGIFISILSFNESNEGGVGLLIFGAVVGLGGIWGAWNSRPWGQFSVPAAHAIRVVVDS